MTQLLIRFAVLFLLVPAAAPAGFAQAATYKVQDSVSDGILNMRDGPGQAHRIIVAIPKGSGDLKVKRCVNPDDDISQYQWCLAEWQGYKGWISSCCIEEVAASADYNSGDLPQFRTYTAPTSSEQSTTYKVRDSVPDGILNLRDGPGQGHKIVIAIPEGSGGLEVKQCVHPDDNLSQFRWCKAEWHGFTGWLSSCCIEHVAAPAPDNSEYPLVFDSETALNKVGLSMWYRTQPPPLAARCYNYGDGGVRLSMDEDFLALYKSKGFSLRSLCMALVSGVRYDPENGKRLATYVFVSDPEGLRRSQAKNEEPDLGVVSPELSLQVPPCFKNGAPYSDCIMNYDLMSGRRFNPKETEFFKIFGEKVESLFRALERKSKFERSRAISEANTHSKRDTWLYRERESQIFWGGGHMSFHDYSAEFPRGFGYALYAEGAAAPAVSPVALRAALDDRRSRSQIDRRRLERMLSGK